MLHRCNPPLQRLSCGLALLTTQSDDKPQPPAPRAVNPPNDRIASFQIPSGCTLTLYEHYDYGGGSTTLSSNTPNVGAVTTNTFTWCYGSGCPGTSDTTWTGKISGLKFQCT